MKNESIITKVHVLSADTHGYVMKIQQTCCFPRTLVEKLKAIVFCPSFNFSDVISSVVGIFVRMKCLREDWLPLIRGDSIESVRGLCKNESESKNTSSDEVVLSVCWRVLTLRNGIGQSLHLREEDGDIVDVPGLGSDIPSSSTEIQFFTSIGISKPKTAFPRTSGAATSHGRYFSLNLTIRFLFLIIDCPDDSNSSLEIRWDSKAALADFRPMPGRKRFPQRDISKPGNKKVKDRM